MTAHFNPRRLFAAATALGLSMLLAACLISPGKFSSSLDVRKDGRFSFSYTGEIYMLGLSKLAELGDRNKEPPVFEPSTCYKDDSMDERKCTKDELDQQKADWDTEQNRKSDKDKRDGEMAKAMFGGLDPTDPKAAQEFADRLSRQAGWKSVIYKGDGLYQVDFAISGRLDHDFNFPTIERFPMANSFVTLVRRADGSMRIDATGFGPSSTGGGMSNFAQLAAMGAAMDKAGKDGEGKDEKPVLPQMEGTFTFTTDAEILANNTDEGPITVTTGKKLEWKVTPRTTVAPTALIKLAN
ncbi:hypothetical protein [Novosphingobium sp. B 225]|uniref:hypothetical protein n=1 Tax=Novosphingobium sp. B 225 TaxID=1961849 RepID=UPI000B4B6067|nr:hypothetical protein [Novosphingobium sp. B 225]